MATPSARAAEYATAERRLLGLHGLDAAVRDVEVPVTGRAHVLDVGHGPALLFVSGGGATGATWSPLLAELDGFRRIAVDRPGFGLTPGVDLRRVPLGTVATTFLAEVLDALDLPSAVVVANSMGSWWATRFAQAQPERVRGLVHIGCPALLLDTSAPLPMRLQGLRGFGSLMLAAQRPSPAGARFQLRMSGDPLGGTEADAAMADVLVAMQRMPDHRRAWLDLLHATVGLRGARPGMAITAAELRDLATPTLFVWGARDTFGRPEVGRRAAALMPDAVVAAVPHGHAPWVSDPAAVAGPVRDWVTARLASPAAG